MTEALVCEQLAQSRYVVVVRRTSHFPTARLNTLIASLSYHCILMPANRRPLWSNAERETTAILSHNGLTLTAGISSSDLGLVLLYQ